MYGISYWDDKDGATLERDLDAVYNNIPGGKQRYWDQVAFDYFPEHYKISVRPCTFDDIVEIDTFNELKQLDPVYNI